MPQPSSLSIDLGLAVLSVVNRGEARLTYQDIAEICGCSHRAIQKIEQRALQKVQKRLSQHLQEYKEHEN